ncbi:MULTISPECIES: hypothetical protein [unclassified Kribbella]|uniref:hypothetical protein n=1 Tax=unclassified Kribbella TaxID=2644121 RepID=UPI0030162FDE
MPTTRTAAAAAAVLMAVLATGCGGSDPATSGTTVTAPTPTPTPTPTPVQASTPTPTPTPVSITGLSAPQILAKAQAAAKAAKSVHVKGAMTDSDGRMALDVRLAAAGGSGSITMDGDRISIMVIGKTAYLRMSDAFWRKQAKSKAEANAIVALIGGRWIKTALTNKDLGDLAAFASKPRFFDSLFEEPGTLRKTAPKTVDGIACIGLRSSDGTLWVDASTARPVRLELSRTDVLTFSEYNQIAAPKAPPAAQVIDGKALGM